MKENPTIVPKHIVEFIESLVPHDDQLTNKEVVNKQILPESATVFSSKDSNIPLEEPDFTTARELLDRRSYIQYAVGKGARRLGLTLGIIGTVKATLQGSNYESGVTRSQAETNGGLVIAGSALALKGDIMIRKALKKLPTSES